ncbi:hypothetical protein [Tenacibaculum piscium]|uniref:hypothetical protein n=1 Tax=Tenacibaculum piscium TaxID=1458515 RepID=UPI001F41F296|nr:hypothetical protein [Tenacibaculum piscium]
MGKIEYTKVEFVRPQAINDREYYELKKRINSNPNYEIVDEGDSFTEHFQPFFKIIGIGLIGGFLLMLIGVELLDGSNWLALFMLPGILLFIGGFYGIIQLFLEAPSYATYKRKKRDYFGRMKNSIEKTDNYDDFVSSFYIK